MSKLLQYLFSSTFFPRRVPVDCHDGSNVRGNVFPSSHAYGPIHGLGTAVHGPKRSRTVLTRPCTAAARPCHSPSTTVPMNARPYTRIFNLCTVMFVTTTRLYSATYGREMTVLKIYFVSVPMHDRAHHPSTSILNVALKKFGN